MSIHSTPQVNSAIFLLEMAYRLDFVEEIYNFAETAEEKEIIHKHIQKIKTM